MCFTEDADCSSPEHFTKYVLGYHFTEGTAGNASSPKGIYSVVMGFKVRMPVCAHDNRHRSVGMPSGSRA